MKERNVSVRCDIKVNYSTKFKTCLKNNVTHKNCGQVIEQAGVNSLDINNHLPLINWRNNNQRSCFKLSSMPSHVIVTYLEIDFKAFEKYASSYPYD